MMVALVDGYQHFGVNCCIKHTECQEMFQIKVEDVNEIFIIQSVQQQDFHGLTTCTGDLFEWKSTNKRGFTLQQFVKKIKTRILYCSCNFYLISISFGGGGGGGSLLVGGWVLIVLVVGGWMAAWWWLLVLDGCLVVVVSLNGWWLEGGRVGGGWVAAWCHHHHHRL
jgi:hypothetical protein